jgi:hypothetical protein
MINFIKNRIYNYWFLYILIVITNTCLVLLRINKYSKYQELSFDKIIGLVFYNKNIIKTFNINDNPFFLTFIYMFMFISIIFTLIYINNSDSKMISFYLHKKTIINTFCRIISSNMVNCLIIILLMVVTHSSIYFLITHMFNIGDLVLLLLYYLKLYLILNIIISIFDILVIFNKEFVWYYFINGFLIIMIYFDITTNSSLILLETNNLCELNYVTCIILFNILMILVLFLIYKKKRDLL